MIALRLECKAHPGTGFFNNLRIVMLDLDKELSRVAGDYGRATDLLDGLDGELQEQLMALTPEQLIATMEYALATMDEDVHDAIQYATQRWIEEDAAESVAEGIKFALQEPKAA